MNDKGRDILKELARANPVKEGDLSDLALKEQEDELFARVQARIRERDHRGTRRPLHYRLALAAVALVVVTVAIVVPLVLLDLDHDFRITASQEPGTSSTDTSSTGVEAQALRTDAALRGIIELARELGLFPDSQEPPDTRLVTLAQTMGVLLPAEGPDYGLASPATRARYALWLWRAFGAHLPANTSVEFKDLASLTTEEQEAVHGLAAAGILKPDGDYFRGSDGLTPEYANVLLDRIRQSIQIQ